MLAFLPVALDMTILHLAVPTLTQALDASSTQVLWIIDIHPLLMGGYREKGTAHHQALGVVFERRQTASRENENLQSINDIML